MVLPYVRAVNHWASQRSSIRWGQLVNVEKVRVGVPVITMGQISSALRNEPARAGLGELSAFGVPQFTRVRFCTYLLPYKPVVRPSSRLHNQRVSLTSSPRPLRPLPRGMPSKSANSMIGESFRHTYAQLGSRNLTMRNLSLNSASLLPTHPKPSWRRRRSRRQRRHLPAGCRQDQAAGTARHPWTRSLRGRGR